MSDLGNSQQPANSPPPPQLTPWRKGQSGNPAGRPKGIERLAREHTEEAIAALVRGLKDPKQYVAAAVALLDRGWGKPKQTIQGDAENPIQWVIRGPSPVESTQEWLRLHAPHTIDADEITIVSDETK